MECEVPSFKGAKKISGLACFPLVYHKDETKLRADLIERGKKFVALQVCLNFLVVYLLHQETGSMMQFVLRIG